MHAIRSNVENSHQGEVWTGSDLGRHFVAVKRRGEFFQPPIVLTDCPEGGNRVLYSGGQELSAHIQGTIINIKNAADRAKDAGKKLRLFVFIHGGLNDYEGSVGRMVRDIGEMIRFKDPEESLQYYIIRSFS